MKSNQMNILKKITRITPLILIAAMHCAVLTAQSSQSPSSNASVMERTYNVDFFIPKRGGLITNTTKLASSDTVYVLSGGEEKRIRLIPGRRSGSIQLTGNGVIELYTKEETIDPNTGQKVVQKKPYMTTSLPADWNGALILVSRGKDTNGGRKAFPMRYDPGHIPNGTLRMMNLSSSPLLVKHANQIQQLPSQNSILYNSLNDTTFNFELSEYRDEEWQIAKKESGRVDPETGNLAIIVPRSARGGVKVYVFDGI